MSTTRTQPLVDDEEKQEIRHGRASSATLVPEMLAATLKIEKIDERPITPHVSDAHDSDEENTTANDKYLSGRSLVLITIGFLLADFVASLDQSMIATALPKLASEFKALDQLAWVVSVFFCKLMAAI